MAANPVRPSASRQQVHSSLLGTVGAKREPSQLASAARGGHGSSTKDASPRLSPLPPLLPPHLLHYSLPPLYTADACPAAEEAKASKQVKKQCKGSVRGPDQTPSERLDARIEALITHDQFVKKDATKSKRGFTAVLAKLQFTKEEVVRAKQLRHREIRRVWRDADMEKQAKRSQQLDLYASRKRLKYATAAPAAAQIGQPSSGTAGGAGSGGNSRPSDVSGLAGASTVDSRPATMRDDDSDEESLDSGTVTTVPQVVACKREDRHGGRYGCSTDPMDEILLLTVPLHDLLNQDLNVLYKTYAAMHLTKAEVIRLKQLRSRAKLNALRNPAIAAQTALAAAAAAAAETAAAAAVRRVLSLHQKKADGTNDRIGPSTHPLDARLVQLVTMNQLTVNDGRNTKHPLFPSMLIALNLTDVEIIRMKQLRRRALQTAPALCATMVPADLVAPPDASASPGKQAAIKKVKRWRMVMDGRRTDRRGPLTHPLDAALLSRVTPEELAMDDPTANLFAAKIVELQLNEEEGIRMKQLRYRAIDTRSSNSKVTLSKRDGAICIVSARQAAATKAADAVADMARICTTVEEVRACSVYCLDGLWGPSRERGPQQHPFDKTLLAQINPEQLRMRGNLAFAALLATLKLRKDHIIRVKQLRSRALDKVHAAKLAPRAAPVPGRRGSFESKEASMDRRLHSLITKEEFCRKNASIFDDKNTRTHKTFAALVRSFNLNADELARAHVLRKRAVSRHRRANTSNAAAAGTAPAAKRKRRPSTPPANKANKIPHATPGSPKKRKVTIAKHTKA